VQLQKARVLVRLKQSSDAQLILATLTQSTSPPSVRDQALALVLDMARDSDDTAGVEQGLTALRAQYPSSPSFAGALESAANYALLRGDLPTAQARYDEFVSRFPRQPFTTRASWRATWISYRLAKPDAAARIEAYLLRFPSTEDTVDALYWRGRLAEAAGDLRFAAACYKVAAGDFPQTYFGQLAADRLTQPELRGSQFHDAALTSMLADHAEFLEVVPERHLPIPKPSGPQAREWADTGRLLASAGLYDDAAAFYRAAIAQERAAGAAGSALSLGRELATVYFASRSYSAAIETLKQSIPQWYRFGFDELATSDWQNLFPLPYASDIRGAARHYHISPYLIAGLIRQESEFDANSISAAQAHGLMQLEASTARYHRRELHRRHISASDLLHPSTNIRLGTAELRSLLSHYPDQLEYALAAYNAGESRVVLWRSQAQFHEPAEFVESIPFSETQAYVQAVIRNERVYAALYGSKSAAPKPVRAKIAN
jgi:soluble lytic murein transglycosylase